MELRWVRHLWGFSGSMADAAPRAKAVGYTGLEASFQEPVDSGPILDALAEHGLELVAQIHSAGFTPHSGVDDHIADFRRKVEWILPIKPVRVNCHPGRDSWPRDEAARYFREVCRIAADLPFPVSFETHRSRILFNPYATVALLEAVADLRLTADLSHWTCVCERLFDLDRSADRAMIEAVAARTDYIHARVGTSQSPQIADPRTPEALATVERFESWWRLILDVQSGAGVKKMLVCPEFGPPPYQPTDPHSGKPAADLEAICDWMAQRLGRTLVDTA
ncbi:MAG: sugar phosphate isomerase/epimerase [Phycisphaeraceae bacterium]|nr:sugar phosphate isomerase/epimerase [Phycisphaeraceae bacterium]